MSTPATQPIPTLLNIAPGGMTWKNWKLVKGDGGFPTRETMEKFLCNPDRVRALEESQVANHETIKRLSALLERAEEASKACNKELP